MEREAGGAIYISPQMLHLSLPGRQEMLSFPLEQNHHKPLADKLKDEISNCLPGELQRLLVVAITDARADEYFARSAQVFAKTHTQGLQDLIEYLLSANSSAETLVIKSNANLLSAWTACVNGALPASLSPRPQIVCSITCGTICEVAICYAGQVIDTATIDIGYDSVLFDEQLKVKAITGAGETFLDATAKPVAVGAYTNEEMLALLGNLMAEAVVQLVARQRAPQLSQRLLLTQTLNSDYTIAQYLLTLPLNDWMPANGGSTQFSSRGHMGPFLALGLQESLRERRLSFTVEQPFTPSWPTGFHTISVECHQLAGDRRQPIIDLPIMPLGTFPQQTSNQLQYLGYRLDEWLRRHGRHTGIPLALSLPRNYPLATESLVRVLSVLEIEQTLLFLPDAQQAERIAELLPGCRLYLTAGDIQFQEGDYGTIAQPTSNNEPVCMQIKRLLFT